MNRKTLVALGVFAVMLVVVLLVQRRPDKGERVGEKPRPLAKVEGKMIDKLAITHKGTTVVVERVPEPKKDTKKGEKGKKDDKKEAESADDTEAKWKVVQPVSYAADTYAANAAVEKIEGLAFGDLVSEQKGKHEKYEVDRKGGIHVVASGGGKTLADFYLGKVLSDFTMFRKAGDDKVFQAVGALRYAFERELKDWRDKTIVSFKQEQARKIRVATEGQVIQLSRKDDKSPWKVDESPVEIDQLDDSAVSNLVSTLSSLSAFDFADDLTPQKAGVDKPAATVTVSLAGGKQVSVLVGNQKDETFWVTSGDAPQIFVLQKYTVDNLMRRPVDFKDKTVLSFKAEDVVALTVSKAESAKTVKLTKKGDAWMANGKKVTEETKVKDAVASLASLKAEGFARHDRQALGLDRPAWTVEVQLKDRTTHTLVVGGVEKDGQFGLVRKGNPDTFLLRQYAVDRFALDPKDFE